MITLNEACEIFLKTFPCFSYIGGVSDVTVGWAIFGLDSDGEPPCDGLLIDVISKEDGSMDCWNFVEEPDKYPTDIPVEIPIEYAYNGMTKWWEDDEEVI